MDQLKKAVPQMVFHTVAQDVTDNIIMNVKKAPFDNPKVRLAVSYAIDRRGLIQASHQGRDPRRRDVAPGCSASGERQGPAQISPTARPTR
jgi:ABC-type transport system substrate-binding protein